MITKSCSFDPLTTRSEFRIPDREKYVSSQYCSVSTRLLFEYKDCLSKRGLVYFVTFTYNDAGVLNICGRNLLNNLHIRQFCNKSVFPKRLNEHGYSFKFAFFGELGDGKGSRGVNNNPHYHALFFLYPLNNCDKMYHTEYNFLELCHNAWNQDFNSLTKDYKSLSRGNVSFSNKGALVIDEKVFSYCASYCIKCLSDVTYKKDLYSFFEKVSFVTLINIVYPIYDFSYSRYLINDSTALSLFRRFLLSKHKSISIAQPYNVSLSDPLNTLSECLRYRLCEFFHCKDTLFDFRYIFDSPLLFESYFYHSLIDTELFVQFTKFLYHNSRLSYRLSCGLGSLGLSHITSNYKLDVSTFLSFKSSTINLPNYYFRKLFFESIRLDDKYVFIRNDKYVDYVRKVYSEAVYRSSIATYRSNFTGFLNSLPTELQSSFSEIPAYVFVSYKAFRGLSFSVYDMPDLNLNFPWEYLHTLDYKPSNIFYIPKSLSSYLGEFFNFSQHPLFFKYVKLHQLSYLYDDYLNSISSHNMIVSSNDYHKFKINHEYEIFKVL